MVEIMRLRARHWSRTAFAMAALFAAMAVGSRIVLGTWPFDGSLEISAVCLAVGAYFHITGRRQKPALPDPAVLLDQAFELARSGRIDDAVALLTRAIRSSPHLWQALQYRGELYLAQQNLPAAAADFSEAIRLAPDEQHLYTLRERASGPAGAA
jgi:tetratricopeptide (TPR) repeat protein